MPHNFPGKSPPTPNSRYRVRTSYRTLACSDPIKPMATSGAWVPSIPQLPRPLGAHNMFIHTTPFRLYHYTSQKMSRGTPCSSTYTHTTMPTNAPYCSFHPCSTSTCNVSHSGPVVWPEYPPFLSPNLDQRVFSTRATVPNSQGINHSIG